MPFPYVFTFYSYKGGVGRSLAVMNVAYRLAGWGRHVLIVDMDLEAPGISGFLIRSGELIPPESPHQNDVLTFLDEAIRAMWAGGEIGEMTDRLPPVSYYIRAIPNEKLAPLAPRLGQVGRFDVLAADQSHNYLDRLEQLGLQELAHDQLIVLSQLLNRYFKAQTFPHRPFGMEPFEPALNTHYDYVLVDSRTGTTEIGGLCVGPLADRLIVLTGLNDQNVNGTKNFLDEAGIRLEPRPANDRPWDDADVIRVGGIDNANLGPKPTIIVASPLPAGEIAYKRERLRTLETLLGIRPVSLSYHPQMALMESVFVRDYPEEMLAGEYERLANHLMAQVRDDSQRLAFDSRDLWNQNTDLKSTITRLLRLAHQRPEVGVSLLAQLAQAATPGHYTDVPERRLMYAFLSQYPEIRLAALNNWGVALADEAKTKQGDDADRFFEAAIQKYAEVLEANPSDFSALNNWGAALLDQAKTKSGMESDQFTWESARKLRAALQLKPDYIDALINLGNAVSRLARGKQEDEADRLYAEAGHKFEEALRLEPDHHVALFNWGTALATQAKEKSGAAADRLFDQAGHKFEQALKSRPEFYEPLANWSTALLDWARAKSGKQAADLLELARGNALQVEGIRPGSGAYNLACVEAREGHVTESIDWLRRAKSAGKRMSQATISADPDFDGVRKQPEFVGFAKSLPEK